MQIPDSFRAAMRAGAAATQMGLATAVCGIGGWLLDGWLGTGPALVLTLGGLGFAGGLVLLWRALGAATVDDSDDSPD